MLAFHWDKMLKIINLQRGKVTLAKEVLVYHWLALFLWGHVREDHCVETGGGSCSPPGVQRKRLACSQYLFKSTTCFGSYHLLMISAALSIAWAGGAQSGTTKMSEGSLLLSSVVDMDKSVLLRVPSAATSRLHMGRTDSISLLL